MLRIKRCLDIVEKRLLDLFAFNSIFDSFSNPRSSGLPCKQKQVFVKVPPKQCETSKQLKTEVRVQFELPAVCDSASDATC